jgi:ssDNA-binding Zn-finger/Zn-ribbon topoisomerase 1
MGLHAIPDPEKPLANDDRQVQHCPVCDGRMELVYNRHHQRVVVCVDCQSGLTVPENAWEIARIKRESKWMPKT